PRARALPAADRRRLVTAIGAVLHERFDVAEVVDVGSAPPTCPSPAADDSRAANICRSIRPDGPGDLYLAVGPGSFFDPRLAAGAGTNHGSPYLYDRAVPLLVRAPGRVAAGVVRDAPVAFGAFARTAAALLGIAPPPAAA